ncbi:hypothetical protein PP175_28440 (plasmid) [Aneurinibacillus sp. Ricciae_BoGa-3]|uniref:hypothetical protein n=1 Tax=Aneurinibacillus sp. Ricciae_BoGa-3 TaxID=3022697 RepID=UPI0023425509|nr:hypothetical protein [Aneurinibacillus sp. Ricciae_BoGa-3]WCK57121.1 hypothetical protein PP175_28440 [Aneurinibacillus sp. Ricciae_BoGa-3]
MEKVQGIKQNFSQMHKMKDFLLPLIFNYIGVSLVVFLFHYVTNMKGSLVHEGSLFIHVVYMMYALMYLVCTIQAYGTALYKLNTRIDKENILQYMNENQSHLMKLEPKDIALLTDDEKVDLWGLLYSISEEKKKAG